MIIFGILIKRVNKDWCARCGRKENIPERVIQEASEGLRVRRENTIKYLKETRPYSTTITRGAEIVPDDPGVPLIP